MRLRPLLLAGLLAAAAARPQPGVADEPLLAVVVAAARPDQPGEDEIAQIFKRRKLFWSDGTRIQPVNLPADHPLRQRFSRHVLHQSPDAQQEYWNEQYFHGVLPPHVLASEEAVLRFVADTAAAIGYLPACPGDPRLRAVLWVTADGRVLKPEGAPACGV
jgi:hypothetical protein